MFRRIFSRDARGFEVPIALFAFNRPDVTRRMFEAIARARPNRLFLIADGPRTDRPGEAEACAEVRQIISAVNWTCDVATNFSPRNMGCGLRMSSGIDWVFKNVDEAILIEDDCVPTPQFFEFCRSMLERYRHDTRIGMISGTNCMSHRADFPGSYFFSRYPQIWGWATWRRSWAFYDHSMTKLEVAKEKRLIESVTEDESLARFWYSVFENVQSGRIDTWDYQLFFASFCNSWLNIIPSKNLVTNIGDGLHATHRKDDSEFTNLPLAKLALPWEQPEFLVRCKKHDEFYERHFHFFAGPARTSWRAISGLGHPEGPFPEYSMDSTIARWMDNRRAEIAVWSEHFAEYELTIYFRNPFCKKQVSVGEASFEIEQADIARKLCIRVPIKAESGWNNFQIAIDALTPDPAGNRQLGIMIEDVRIGPMQQKKA
jgi:hypothetical protein